ncbi:MAG: VOC family protein [Oceanospirillaceae bacterium]|nr:VOC family protein [Oceanospirillaceae bacterium]
MNNPTIPVFSSISLSHFELYVNDVSSMQAFYTLVLGFVVTDRGAGGSGMVFLSRSVNEHHQLVLTPRQSEIVSNSPIDHIAFRVNNIDDLRIFYQGLVSHTIKCQTVSHGTTFSIYFVDPENNRLELFTDTPWHVNQPCRFEVDFALGNEELLAFTHQKIKGLPGFVEVGGWKESHIIQVNVGRDQ